MSVKSNYYTRSKSKISPGRHGSIGHPQNLDFLEDFDDESSDELYSSKEDGERLQKELELYFKRELEEQRRQRLVEVGRSYVVSN